MRARREDVKTFLYFVKFLRFVCGGLALFMFMMNWIDYRETMPEFQVEKMFGSNQFMSCLFLFTGFVFIHSICRAREKSRMVTRMKKMDGLCKKLKSIMVNFRLETSDRRLEKYEALVENIAQYFGVTEAEKEKMMTSSQKRQQAGSYEEYLEMIESRPFHLPEIREAMINSRLVLKDSDPNHQPLG